LSLNTVPFIGDTKRDVDAARAAKANPVLVRTGKGPRTAAAHPELLKLPWFNDLSDAADHLLEGDLRT
jgi:D-glycero-D-manno-heptose 1,7-bisphosphate phosphatase